jgi:hypothetical protein
MSRRARRIPGTVVRRHALALLCALLALPVDGAEPPPAGGSDVPFASYAFANEFGSGIYDIGGRTIQIYQLPLSFQLRDPTPGNAPPGLTFLAPITIGFFDYKSQDLLHLQLPKSIGTLSLQPGVRLEYRLGDTWRLYPYIKAGWTFGTNSGVEAAIYSVGMRSDYLFQAFKGSGLWSEELLYAGVRFRGDVPNDSFTRLRNGAELRRDLPWTIQGRPLQIAPFGVLDIYLKAPTGPASGISAQTLQFSAGFALGVHPMWEILGIELPRIGIGYRSAGELSGWYVLFGDPF